jgi:anthranilate synthase component 1
MAAGLFGYLGYDMVRQMERLPTDKPPGLGLPDGIFLRPTVMAIFDNIEDRVTVVSPAWPDPELSARAAYDVAAARLAATVADFGRPLPHPGSVGEAPSSVPAPRSNVTPDDFHAMVERAKRYILAGDIFQVVLSQRFAVPFRCRPSRSIARCAASTPRPSSSSSISAASPWSARARRSWSGCATARSPSGRSPGPGRAAHAEPRTSALAPSCWPTRRSGPSI